MMVMSALLASTEIIKNKKFIQHGTTTVYSHCRNVAYMSLRIARFFKAKVDTQSLVRGALLHDYYLYDWHDKAARPKLHGYYHPGIALKNAKRTLKLNSIEEDIIIHHMFPLTWPWPKTKEGWIVSLADKLCSLYETFKFNEVHLNHRAKALERECSKRKGSL